jgi:hypothetical protein
VGADLKFSRYIEIARIIDQLARLQRSRYRRAFMKPQ